MTKTQNQSAETMLSLTFLLKLEAKFLQENC